jgi:hypothetical protein
MDILSLSVPLWLLLAVVIIIALLFDYRHRRLQRRVEMLDREFYNMDRWADAVDERLNVTTPSILSRAANTGTPNRNDLFQD